MRTLKVILIALLLVVIGLVTAIALWVVTPSSNYIQVSGYSVEKLDGEWWATSARDLPHGSILADWSVTFIVNSPEHNRVCRAEGRDVYDEGRPSPVTYTVSPWADACLNVRDPVFVTVTRTVRLFGLIPLYPAQFSFQVLPHGDIRAVPSLPPPSLLAPPAD